VSFNETFWVAAAAAAPVIALANQLTVTASARMGARAVVLLVADRAWVGSRNLAAGLYVAGTVNLFAQTVALAAALFSLAGREDLISGSVVTWIEISGLFVVGLTAAFLGFDRTQGGSLQLSSMEPARSSGREPARSSDTRRTRARARVVKSVSISGGRGSRRR
jgi:hypothetical protein